MRLRYLAVPFCLLVSGCDDDPRLPPAAAVWEAAVQVGEAGSGYVVGPRLPSYTYGGPRRITVDAAGGAFLASLYAAGGVDEYSPVRETWGSIYVPGSGWTQRERLAAGAGIVADEPSGIGLTPDGALFGWQGCRSARLGDLVSIGLRGFDVRTGWQPAGTLLDLGASTSAMMLTDSSGTPSVVYSLESGTWLVRHAGVLQAPELVFARAATAFAADGSGALAVADYQGALAIRLAGGSWSRTVLPALAGVSVAGVALIGRPAGGFVAVWMEGDSTGLTLTYAAAPIQSNGALGPRTSLGGFAPPPTDPMRGADYDTLPRLTAGAGGAVAAAWRADTRVCFTREIGGTWEPLPAMPATGGGPTRLSHSRPFDLALDRSGTLLAAWETEEGLVSAQSKAGETWSATTPLASGASDIQLAMNADGVAFAAWREGARIMAARSPRR